MKFQYTHEVKAYLSQPTLTCLICGNSGFILLSAHLRTCHQITPRQYKLMFNIPLTYSLIPPQAKEARSHRASPNRDPKEHAAKMRAGKSTTRSYPIEFPRLERKKYPDYDYSEVFNKLRQGFKMREALSSTPGAPSMETFCRMKKRFPELEKQYQGVLNSLPFSQQVKKKLVTKELYEVCKSLKATGLSQNKIAKQIGISTALVSKLVNEFDTESNQ